MMTATRRLKKFTTFWNLEWARFKVLDDGRTRLVIKLCEDRFTGFEMPGIGPRVQEALVDKAYLYMGRITK